MNKNTRTLKSLEENVFIEKFIKDKVSRKNFVVKFALETFGNLNILTQPVCTKCEQIAAYDINDTVNCPHCGRTSPVSKTLTLEQYLEQELIKKGRKR